MTKAWFDKLSEIITRRHEHQVTGLKEIMHLGPALYRQMIRDEKDNHTKNLAAIQRVEYLAKTLGVLTNDKSMV